MTLKRCKRSNNQFFVYEAREFQSFIDIYGLVDFSLKGENWTWSNDRGTPYSSIDRFLVNHDLLLDTPSLTQKVLIRSLFNHFAIVLDPGGIKWGLSPFRIDNKWYKIGSLKTMVESVEKFKL